MKKKFSSMGRVAIALVLALSLCLMTAVPVMATHTSSATVAFTSGESTMPSEASSIDVAVTNVAGSPDSIAIVKIDFSGTEFTDVGAGTAPTGWTGTVAAGVVTYTADTEGDRISPDASETFVPTVTNPVVSGLVTNPTVSTTDDGPTAATLTMGAGTSAVTYTAVTPGTGGNSITVDHVNTASSASLDVSVSVTDITVTLADDGTNPTSTADEVATAVNADPEANLLVVAVSGGGGVVVDEGPTSLADGTDQTVDHEPTVTGTLTVEGIALDEDSYKTGDVATVTVADDSANGDPGSRESILVTAESDLPAPAHSIELGLLETDVDTGVFTETFTLVGVTAGTGELLVSHGATITASYTGLGGVTDTAQVDNSPPTIDNLTPGDEAVVNTDPLVISADITDLDSGVNAESLVMTVNSEEVEAIFEADTLSFTYPLAGEVGAPVEGLYTVTVDASDNAGNAALTEAWSFNYDVTGPAVSNQTPEPDSFISTRTPTVSFDVTDASGITRTSITLDIEYIGSVTPAITPTLSEATAYHVEYQVSTAEGAAFVDGQAITVTVAATDLALNDIAAEESTWEFTYDATAPELTAARTGWTWVPDDPGAAADTNSRTSIMVTFSESLDEATVEASDFLVADLVTPSAIEVQDNLVFLTITEMATDATPSVELVGEVSDTAGNAQSEGLVEEAEDWIDPILAVVVDPDLGLDETDITITVTSSEPLAAVPTVQVTEADGDVVSATMVPTNTITWEDTYTLDVANGDGMYAVTARGTDVSANSALAVSEVTGEDIEADGVETVFTLAYAPIADVDLDGDVDPDDITPTAGTISEVDAALGVITFTAAPDAGTLVSYKYFAGATANFEGDFTVPAVSQFTPADGTEVTSTHPWITITFSEDVQLLSATFDEVDVLEQLYTVGDDLSLYTLATADLEMGEHTISVLAEDLAGNEMAAADSATFTVVVATAEIQLYPGWNLVSIPLIPDDSSIETVLGEVTVDSVWAYDAVNKVWLSYSPGEPSDLTEMKDGVGYWVRMSAPATLTVTGITMPEPPAVPPTYSVVAGWNLIGFKSMDVMTVGEYLITAPDYGPIWAYQAGAYTALVSGNDMNPGQGYWVWFPAAATIVPPGAPSP